MKKVSEAIADVIEAKLSRFNGSQLTKDVCTQIFLEVFEVMREVCERANVKIGNEAMNYLSQEYYLSLVINEAHELDPNIFSQLAKLENIPTVDIATMVVFMSGTPMAIPLITEIKKRG